MGLGAWAWGDRVVWQYGRGYTDEDIRQAFQTSIAEGVRFIDTAEVYGSGRSERLTGQFVKETDQPVLIATKFFPMPWRLTKNSIRAALTRSLERLGVETVDLYQIHWPSPLLSPETAMEGMSICVEKGMTRTVGISNFDQSAMLRAYSTLSRHNIPLASNQVHFSLLNRTVEKNGLLARCKELGVRLIAYSPLEMGMLTGKYTSENPPTGTRGASYGNLLKKIVPLLKLMTEIGQDHGGKSNSQVALNWCICKETMPIPGAKNAAQAYQNAGALGWKLTADEVAKLDEASDEVVKQ
ncbi:MAG: aldo/keto reductase [Chloroflexi bacterium]|nr:aldo/keto reductase [Chloroflexota bacterium]MBI3341239.1 aldo/keto reductase [Chloroflexota bacterium]